MYRLQLLCLTAWMSCHLFDIIRNTTDTGQLYRLQPVCTGLSVGCYCPQGGTIMKFDILIAGVGGQGVVLASRLLATAAIDSGYHVATAETIGMAQREGSVTSHVRIGDDVCGSLIPGGNANLIIGLEPAEAARNIHFL